VGGIISLDTTWNKGGSPYIVTDTVQIPSGVTLTIEPGVTITWPEVDVIYSDMFSDMFLVHGLIYAHGTVNDKIIFDGGFNPTFFNLDGSNIDTFIDLDNCVIRNGGRFWSGSGGHGSFNLTHSELTDLSWYSYVWYPESDVHIEYNTFTNAGHFSIGHRDSVKVYIQYNLFIGKNPTGGDYYYVKNWASYDESETVVRYNSFININGIVLELPNGYDAAAMSAPENYWNTQDTNVIDSMIWDKNDNITCAGYINYLPILTAPHPDTPLP